MYSSKIGKYVIAGYLTLASALYPGYVGADDIKKGVKGSTNVQIDARLKFSNNGVLAQLIGKYWDGDEIGKWGFVNLKGYNVSVGGGPRFRFNNLHLLTFGGVTFPTGDSDGTVDIDIGLLASRLFDGWEIDGTIAYKVKGKSGDGEDQPNELYVGILGAMNITEAITAGIGITDKIKGGNHSPNLRGVVRYAGSGWHLEIIVDKDFSGGYSGTALGRFDL